MQGRGQENKRVGSSTRKEREICGRYCFVRERRKKLSDTPSNAVGVIREAYEKLLEKDTLSVQYSFKEFREVLTLIELLKNAIVPENSQPPAVGVMLFRKVASVQRELN